MRDSDHNKQDLQKPTKPTASERAREISPLLQKEETKWAREERGEKKRGSEGGSEGRERPTGERENLGRKNKINQVRVIKIK